MCLKLVSEFLHFHQFPGDANAANPQTTLWRERACSTQSHIHGDTQRCAVCIYLYVLGHTCRCEDIHSFRQILSALFRVGTVHIQTCTWRTCFRTDLCKRTLEITKYFFAFPSHAVISPVPIFLNGLVFHTLSCCWTSEQAAAYMQKMIPVF